MEGFFHLVNVLRKYWRQFLKFSSKKGRDSFIMYQIDFHKPMHIHFIGIGGISMSGLAEILLEEDFVISGSDAKESELTKLLEARGARIFIGQRASNITEDIELVVYTAAIHPDNPEFK